MGQASSTVLEKNIRMGQASSTVPEKNIRMGQTSSTVPEKNIRMGRLSLQRKICDKPKYHPISEIIPRYFLKERKKT